MSEHDETSLQQCPKCTTLIEGDAKFCRNCGHQIGPIEASILAGDPTRTDDERVPFTVSGELVPARRRIRQPVPVSQWSMAIVGGVGVVVVVAAVIAFGWLQAQAPETSAVAPTTPPAPRAPATVTPAPRQQWTGRRQASWAADGSKTITFELQANEDVPVWMTRARPQLVVRCVSRTTEVYVSLGSAASVEEQSGIHTVRIQIDDDPPLLQQWTDSTSSHELFAPDGLAFTRRLAEARHMHFGFTPFNSAPVVADFSVQGFEELAPLVAKTCGWSLDGPNIIYERPRSARLK